MESEPTELHIILREVEDERFPGVKGVMITMDPDREGVAPEDLSRVEMAAIQMIQLFQGFQQFNGARQFLNGEEIEEGESLAIGQGDVEWPEEVEV